MACLVCKGVLKDPVSTPCGHHFCKPCLEKRFSVREFLCRAAGSCRHSRAHHDHQGWEPSCSSIRAAGCAYLREMGRQAWGRWKITHKISPPEASNFVCAHNNWLPTYLQVLE